VGGMTYWRQRPGQALGPVAANIIVVASNLDGMVGDPVRILTWHPDAVEGVRLLCQAKLASHCYAEPHFRPDGTVHSLGIFALQGNKGTALDLALRRLELTGSEQ
jgi:hypothetical protein